MNTYLAHATSESPGSEPVDGNLTIDRWTFRFQSPTANLDIPLARLEISIDDSGIVFFSDPDQADWSIYTYDARVLQDQSLLQQAHTRAQLRGLRHYAESRKRVKITLWCLGAFATVAILAFILMGVAVRVLVARVPPSWEKKVGDDMIAEMKQTEVMVTNPKYLARLDQAVKPLLAGLPTNEFPYQFYLVDDRDPNAFALPGGHVVVNMGLLEFADTPDQVAGAMAHEIAHVNCKHHIRHVLASLGPAVLCELCMSTRNGFLQVLGGSSELLITRGFSQEYELEADATGWDYLLAANINPHASIEILSKLRIEEERHSKSDFEPQAFSTHPATAKRVRILEKKWAKLKDEKTAFLDLGKWE